MRHSFWDERYAQEEYVYGTKPNVFLKEVLPTFSAGKILFPAEGEGRNAVFAASLGWDVKAFDNSNEGQRKALDLARENQVEIDYQLKSVEEVDFSLDSFDAIALIYAHFPESKRREYHRKLVSYLKVGGVMIIEAFGKKHSDFQIENPSVGGPKDSAMLYDIDELKGDFPEFRFMAAYPSQVELSEGDYHVGTAHVVRIIAIKDRVLPTGF